MTDHQEQRVRRLEQASRLLHANHVDRSDWQVIAAALPCVDLDYLPPPDLPGELWSNAIAREFVEQQSSGLQFRSAVASGLQLRSADLAGPASLNRETRSVETVASTERPVLILDAGSGRLVEEILLADGFVLYGENDFAPLLVDHNRNVDSVVGRAVNWRRSGDRILATLIFGKGGRSNQVLEDVAEGNLRSVSIGYRTNAATIVPKGKTQQVAGRTFTALDYDLKVVTRFTVHELSVVSVPADPDARIRSKEGNQNMPAIHSRSSVTARPTREGLASALLVRAGLDPVANRWRAVEGSYRRDVPTSETHRAAEEGQRLSALAFPELLREAARLDWHDVPDDTGKVWGYLARRCATPEQARAFTTSSVGSLLEDATTNLFVAEIAASDSTSGMVTKIELLDTREALTGNVYSGTVSPIARGQEAVHLELQADHGQTIRLQSFGGQVAIDEQDMVDHDFDVFARHVTQLAASTRAVRPDLLFHLWMSNPTLDDGLQVFDRGNLLSSAGLDATKLGAAMAAFRKMAYASRPLNEPALFLLVPAALEAAAQRLVRDLDAPGSKPPIVRTDPRLDLGVKHPFTGSLAAGSATSWYLVSPRATTLAMLKGMRQPKLNTWFLSNGKFGVGAACHWYLGACISDPLAIQRNDA